MRAFTPPMRVLVSSMRAFTPLDASVGLVDAGVHPVDASIGLVDAGVHRSKLRARFFLEATEVLAEFVDLPGDAIYPLGQFLYLDGQGQKVLGEQSAQHRLAHLGVRGDEIEDLPQRMIRRQVEVEDWRGQSRLPVCGMAPGSSVPGSMDSG